MKVVLADVQPEPLAKTVDELAGARHRCHRRPDRRRRRTNRSCALRDARSSKLRRRARALQQRGHRRRRRRPDVGARAPRLGVGDRRQRLGRHPRHQRLRPDDARKRRRGPRRQHLQRQRRHLAAAVDAAVRRDEGRRRHDHGVPLRPARRTRRLSASVLFPGPHMLRTGLFESWRSRPDRFAKTRPRKTPYTTVEALEEQMKAAGVDDRLHRAGRGRRARRSTRSATTRSGSTPTTRGPTTRSGSAPSRSSTAANPTTTCAPYPAEPGQGERP